MDRSTAASAAPAWVRRAHRRRRRARLAVDAVTTETPADRALYITEVTGDLVHANRGLQSLTHHIADVADEGSKRWHEDILTLLVPMDQASQRRVAVPSRGGETVVAPVSTPDGGVAWQQRSLSLADLNRWRDRTLTRNHAHADRRRGLDRQAEQVFLPASAIETALAAINVVFDEVAAAYDIDFDEVEDGG